MFKSVLINPTNIIIHAITDTKCAISNRVTGHYILLSLWCQFVSMQCKELDQYTLKY